MWLIQLAESYRDEDGHLVLLSDEEYQLRRGCILDELHRVSSGSVHGELMSKQSILVDGPSDEIKGVLAARVVRYLEPECSKHPSELCDCTALDLENCVRKPFCHGLDARPYDEAAACWHPSLLAGCTQKMGCNDASRLLRDAGGDIWEFNRGCLPDAPGWSECELGGESGGQLCDPEIIHAPACD